jgi:hypothetical protein
VVFDLLFGFLEVIAVLAMGFTIAALASAVGIVRAAQLLTRTLDLVL